MAEDSNETSGTPPSKNAAGERPAKPESSSDLPNIDSPPLSPAGENASAAPEPAIEPTDLVVFTPEVASATHARFRFKARHKRNALLAASVAIAAAVGVVIGAMVTSQFIAPARKEVSSLSDRMAMQRSIGKLSKDVAALEASIAATNANAHSEIAKITQRLRSAPEITGLIPVPPAAVAAPLPPPRPAAAAIRPPVVRDWSIRYVRDGYVYVRGHGDTYQVQLGAPLPGLGPVQQVKRQDGHWLVVTPKGLIVSMRDRRFFEQF
jgi:hypothetical protein